MQLKTVILLSLLSNSQLWALSTGLDELKGQAESGESWAQFNLALKYFSGDANPAGTREYDRAAEWFEKAAVQDNVDAQFALGTLYCQGKGVGQDKQRCKELLLKASDNGHVEAARTLTEWFSNSGK